jgi:hypothetical protein
MKIGGNRYKSKKIGEKGIVNNLLIRMDLLKILGEKLKTKDP